MKVKQLAFFGEIEINSDPDSDMSKKHLAFYFLFLSLFHVVVIEII